MDVRTMRGADCGCDHHLVPAILQVRFKRPCQKSIITNRREWSKLTDPVMQQRFQITLTNRFTALDEVNDVHEAAETFAQVINECTRKMCPTVRRQTQSWIPDESLKLAHQRRQSKLTNMTRYRQLNKELCFRLKNEWNAYAYWTNVSQKHENATHKREYRYLYTILRRLGGKVKRNQRNIRNTDGTFLRSDNEHLNSWKEYFQSLYNRPRPESNAVDPLHLQDVAVSVNDKKPTIDEIKFAIRQLKTGKIAGPDEVIAETIKTGGKPILSRLCSLLRMIWHSDNISNAWEKGLIVPLFKKGDNRECKNYRGISLLSAVGEVFMKVIQQCLKQK